MEMKWFSQEESNGNIRHRLYSRDTKFGAWNQTPYFIDSAKHKSHYTYNKKHGLYGSGMGRFIQIAQNMGFRPAACFGGFDKLSDAKKLAESKLSE
jgi:hypothetical protein